jgi:ABC-type oligopeptide transport system ATPase subunit
MAGGGAAMAGGGAAMAGGGAAVSKVQSSVDMHAIFMIGNVGSGKTAMSLVLQRLLVSMGFIVTIINMDKLSKKNKQGQAKQIFKQDVERGEREAQSKNMPYVVIFDLCNEKVRPPNFDCFGLKIRGKFECHIFEPNFFKNDVPGYQGWTGLNVINRARPITENDHWFLTIHEAGLAKCIEVSNKKLSAMLSTKGLPAVAPINESMSESALRAFLQPHAERYAKRVAEQGTIDEVASRFIKEEIVRK